MDAVTHAMTGMLIGSVVAVKKDNLYPLLLTGAVASVMPDLDSFIRVFGSDFFFKYHRVFTHTLLGVPLLAVIASLPAWIWKKNGYLLIYMIALTATLIHLGMDVLCLWPIKLMYPLSDTDFALNVFNNKDTSYVALIGVTASVMGMLYYHQMKQVSQAGYATQNQER